MNIHKQKWVTGLDTLRFVLASIVLLSHVPIPWIATLKQSTHPISKLAAAVLPNLYNGVGAVIAFFIISGFVIHYPHINGIKSVRKFMIRRWVRIGLPLLVIAPISLYYHCFDRIPVWSLYCELAYYSIYPILCVVSLSWKTKTMLAFLISAIIVVVFAWHDVLSFVKQTNQAYSGGYWQLGIGLTWLVGLPCWLLGVYLAEVVSTSTDKVSTLKIWSYRIVVLGISILLNVLHFHFFFGFILSMNLFALVLYHWLKTEILFYQHHKANTHLEQMGKFSYSLYLIHGVCFLLITHWLPFNNYTYPIVICLDIALAYVFYLLIEKPTHQLAQRLSK
jgi:peptidoglycan/LPS O-acetylase OafA/YrhL